MSSSTLHLQPGEGVECNEARKKLELRPLRDYRCWGRKGTPYGAEKEDAMLESLGKKTKSKH